MRQFCVFVVCVSLLMLGCDGRSTLPSSPTPTPSFPPAPAPPPPQQPVEGLPIVLGDVVTGRVTEDDPLCGPRHRCRYYRLTVSGSGALRVTMTWDPQVADPYPLDIGVIDPSGRVSLPTIGPGTQRQVSLPVSAGRTYVIEIWSAAAPGEEFALQTAIQ